MSEPLLRKAHQVAVAARERGGRALLVGGFVRDELLGLAPKDADIEVYGLEAPILREILAHLGKVDAVGESFRVLKLTWRERGERFELDVSLPRRDRKVGTGHKGFEVEGDPFATIEDAARRRDFTVNAILRDPLTNELLDPFGGVADLHARVLRMVDAGHFGEDSLRVLRAMQFAARFEMTIDPATATVCRAIDLSDLPKERVWGEWEKLLLKAEKPSIGLKAARELGILELLPKFAKVVARRGEGFGEALDAVARDNLSAEKRITLMLTVLATSNLFATAANWQARWRSFNNLQPNFQIAEELLDGFGLKTLNGYNLRAQVLALVSDARTPCDLFLQHDEGGVPDGILRRVSCRCDPILLEALSRAYQCRGCAEWFRERMQRLDVWNGPPAPLLMGRHLLEMGLQPGPRIGEITRAVYELQLDGEVSTLDEAQSAARRLLEQN